MKMSGCLVRLRPSISLGRRRGCSETSARRLACPLWDSQSMASQGIGAPSTSSQGAQDRWPRHSSTSSRLSTKLAFLSLGSLAFFYCLAPFWGPTSPSSKSSTCLFFLKSGLTLSPRSAGSCGGRGGRLTKTWVLGTSFEVDPLFLLAIKPPRPILYFRSMPFSSSSSELAPTLATVNFGRRATESQSSSVSKSKSSTSLSATLSSSSRWNWSILASRDNCTKAISSLGIATS